jgi:hypothetical protein
MKTILKRARPVFGLMAAVALATSTHANVLLNPSFESAVGNRVTDWTWFDNAWQSSANARTGGYSLQLYGNWQWAWNAAGAFQSQPTVPGDTWDFTGYGLNYSADPLLGQNFGLLKIVWFDSGNNALQPLPGQGALFGANPGIESAFINSSTPTDQWHFLSASGVAPEGAASVQLLVLFLQPNFESGAAWFDDISAVLTPIPEPSSMALLGLGLLSLPLLRRRLRH